MASAYVLGVVAHPVHHLGHIDLAQRLDQRKEPERRILDGLVLQEIQGFRTDALEQGPARSNRGERPIEGLRQPFLGHPGVQGSDDHPVGLNRSEVVDVSLEVEPLAVGGDEALGRLLAGREQSGQA